MVEWLLIYWSLLILMALKTFKDNVQLYCNFTIPHVHSCHKRASSILTIANLDQDLERVYHTSVEDASLLAIKWNKNHFKALEAKFMGLD